MERGCVGDQPQHGRLDRRARIREWRSRFGAVWLAFDTARSHDYVFYSLAASKEREKLCSGITAAEDMSSQCLFKWRTASTSCSLPDGLRMQ